MGVQFMNGKTTAKYSYVTNEIDILTNRIDKIDNALNDINTDIHNEEQTRLQSDLLLTEHVSDVESKINAKIKYIQHTISPIINVLCNIVTTRWFMIFNYFAMMVEYCLDGSTIIITPTSIGDIDRKEFKKKYKKFKNDIRSCGIKLNKLIVEFIM